MVLGPRSGRFFFKGFATAGFVILGWRCFIAVTYLYIRLTCSMIYRSVRAKASAASHEGATQLGRTILCSPLLNPPREFPSMESEARQETFLEAEERAQSEHMTQQHELAPERDLQIAFARHNFEDQQALIRSADAKAGAFITLLLFLAAIVIPLGKEAVPKLRTPPPAPARCADTTHAPKPHLPDQDASSQATSAPVHPPLQPAAAVIQESP